MCVCVSGNSGTPSAVVGSLHVVGGRQSSTAGSNVNVLVILSTISVRLLCIFCYFAMWGTRVL